MEQLENKQNPFKRISLSGESVEDYLKRIVKTAVRTARPPRGSLPLPRWACVQRVFLFGSRHSQWLCHGFGFDPDELIEAQFCDDCPRDPENADEEASEMRGWTGEELRDAVLGIFTDVDARVENGANSNGHLEFVHKKLKGVLDNFQE